MALDPRLELDIARARLNVLHRLEGGGAVNHVGYLERLTVAAEQQAQALTRIAEVLERWGAGHPIATRDTGG